MYGASVKGASHVKSGTPCHDAHFYQLLDDDAGIVAAVSDGMGSALHAEVGSRLASEFVVEYLAEMLSPAMDDETVIALIETAFLKTNARLKEEAEITDVNIRDLNATLLVFLSMAGRQFYGQVGDCTAVAEDEDGFKVVVEQQRGEYANATYSITDPVSVVNGLFGVFEKPYASVALMSDGVESISISSKDNAVSEKFFEPFFRVLKAENFDSESLGRSLARFLETDRLNKRSDDDKTLLFIRLSDAE